MAYFVVMRFFILFTILTIACYPKEAIMESTAYCLYGTTASGYKTQPGTIAVDPRIIPLGTKVWVEGYGWAVARDTGGAIKGYIVDVWFPTETQCFRWGRRKVKVKW